MEEIGYRLNHLFTKNSIDIWRIWNSAIKQN
jgi:hypothetical protein